MKRYLLMTFLAAASLLAVPPSVIAAPSGSAAPSVTAARSATRVVMASPVGPAGHLLPGYRVAKRLPGGMCKPTSTVTGNAYRCVVRFTYDPCWLTAKHAYVVCLTSPYQRKVTRIHVTRGYHNAGGLGDPVRIPWGLQLANGVKTTRIGGDFGKVRGQRINYSYNDFKVVLYGRPDKSQPVWRIRKARDAGGFRFKPAGWVAIKKAWFGSPTRLG